MSNNQLKVLELFAGSRCVGKAAEELGMKVFSVDWEPFENIDYVGDVQDMTINDVPFVPDIVWYCQYGDDRAKPTDIWTNNDNWIPRPVCHNGNKDCHHQPAPRGSKTGTQGRKGSYNRSKIPHELCVEALKAV